MADGKNFLIGQVFKIKSWLEKSFLGPVVAKLFAGGFLLAVFTNGISAILKGVGGWLKGVGVAILQPLLNGSFITAFKDFFQYTLPEIFSSGGSYLFKGIGAFIGDINSALGGALLPITVIVTSLLSSFGGFGGLMERIGKIFKDAGE